MDDPAPYVQMLLCRKTQYEQSTAPLRVPQKILAYINASACPSGWVTTPTGTGRFLVGLPENGTPNESFGADPLGKPGDKAGHTHTINGTVDAGTQQVAEDKGCNSTFGLCSKHHGKPGDKDFSAESDSPASTLPYFAVNLCQPDT